MLAQTQKEWQRITIPHRMIHLDIYVHTLDCMQLWMEAVWEPVTNSRLCQWYIYKYKQTFSFIKSHYLIAVRCQAVKHLCICIIQLLNFPIWNGDAWPRSGPCKHVVHGGTLIHMETMTATQTNFSNNIMTNYHSFSVTGCLLHILIFKNTTTINWDHILKSAFFFMVARIGTV
jgi:hypothetical protein